ncbi:nuclear transport factor 2 family protein [Algoriphagus sp. D3-2-R+10]|uniref:nuclear transport factor 2 family protein n=1 Tax=Algoriphagus aurantiacus TaxID=3103948 RepID=UPI002B38CD31|nr:nuclear transport factor 2 family protein [Algoriphagus sp. D3-2-R+10]MEB2774189.1 nuclear transport factor 2 family protein [Algoriphagus sp. D3-2-R+10]
MKIFTMFIVFAILASLTLSSCRENSKDHSKFETLLTTLSKTELENEAWHMEELYWEYVQKSDTVSYKTLWHANFIGYPSFGDGVSDKSKIAIWIPELHKDPDLKYSYTLYKKASNAIEGVVIVFYDTDYFWTDKDNKVVRKETYKFTHTWKKVDGKWVILGGMAAMKNQDVLND